MGMLLMACSKLHFWDSPSLAQARYCFQHRYVGQVLVPPHPPRVGYITCCAVLQQGLFCGLETVTPTSISSPVQDEATRYVAQHLVQSKPPEVEEGSPSRRRGSSPRRRGGGSPYLRENPGSKVGPHLP